MHRIVIFLFIVLFGLFPAGRAFGDDAPSPEGADGAAGPSSAAPSSSESDRDAEAKLQFETGREFFNQGRYEESAIAMKRAFELRPSYKILYYLGWAEGETGNFARALNAYNQYLAEAPADTEADRIEEVRKAVEKLRAKVGSLDIVSAPDGAKVKVDNEVMGVTPLSHPVSVDVGKHEVTVTDGINVLLTEVIRIAGGQEISLEVGQRAPESEAEMPTSSLPSQPAAALTDASAAVKHRNKGRVAAFAGFGVTAALAGAAAVTGALALQKSNEIEDRCAPDGTCYSEDYNGDFESETSTLHSLGITTDVLIGVASAAAVTSVVLLVVSRNKTRETIARRDRFLLSASPFGVFISGRF